MWYRHCKLFHSSWKHRFKWFILTISFFSQIVVCFMQFFSSLQYLSAFSPSKQCLPAQSPFPLFPFPGVGSISILPWRLLRHPRCDWLSLITFLHHPCHHMKFAFLFEKLVSAKLVFSFETDTALQQTSNSFLTNLPPVINHVNAPNPLHHKTKWAETLLSNVLLNSEHFDGCTVILGVSGRSLSWISCRHYGTTS